MNENAALWLKAKQTEFVVAPAALPVPSAGEIVIRVRAVAVNPMDRLVRSMGDFITPWLTYPFIPGSDVAGKVVALGPDVTRFRLGDRVLGYAAGADKGHRSAEGGFQTFVVLKAHMASAMPASLTFEAAAVLPLGLSTAATALFEPDCLALNRPSAAPRSAGKTVLIWGGSTSVGSNAIQLAVAAGYDVITTSSPRNFTYVSQLGARLAFDYASKSVVADIVAALEGRQLAGALAIGVGSAAKCLDIVGASAGRRFVAMATPPASFDHVPSGRGRLARLLPVLMRSGIGFARIAIKKRLARAHTKFIWGSALLNTDVGPMIFEDFLPAALAEGRFRAAPDPIVVGHGLSQIPLALDRQLQGVSAAKFVVTL